MNKIGKDIFRGYSAGSSPVGFVNPMSILMLESKGHDVSCLSSKSWDQYASAPHMDFIITVCDNAAGEVCPVWPGKPISAHWGVTDPSLVAGSEEVKYQAFLDTYLVFEKRIKKFISLSDNINNKVTKDVLQNIAIAIR
tara:strand:- start:3455 stop:3871 length:417 start_codon:yes stop_codon:yes gene_type:complete